MDGDSGVFVALKRPHGYEDVHAELVAGDAMRPGWPWELLSDEGTDVVVTIDCPEGYERLAAREVAKEAISATWPTWSTVKPRLPAA